jgi:hypothetical protein
MRGIQPARSVKTMAELPEYARQAIDDLRQSVMRKMNEMTETLQGLNALERNYNLPLTDIGEFVTTVTPPETQLFDSKRESHAPSKPSNVAILPDTYLGAPPLDAAKHYIGSVGHAVSFEEIVAAVTKGGAATVGPNWRDALEISLMRSGQEVVKVAEKTYGLVRFYSEEQIRRLRDSRRPIPMHPRKKKSKNTRKAKTSTAKQRNDSETAAPVETAMNNGNAD